MRSAGRRSERGSSRLRALGASFARCFGFIFFLFAVFSEGAQQAQKVQAAQLHRNRSVMDKAAGARRGHQQGALNLKLKELSTVVGEERLLESRRRDKNSLEVEANGLPAPPTQVRGLDKTGGTSAEEQPQHHHMMRAERGQKQQPGGDERMPEPYYPTVQGQLRKERR